MPLSKSALRRYKIIDRCLRTPNVVWTRKKLFDEINEQLLQDGLEAISESLLRVDMGDIQELYGAPVIEEKIKGKVTYRYEDPYFSIHNLPVTKEDVALLQQAVSIMQQIKGFNLSNDIADVVTRLEQKIKYEVFQSKSCISFENAPVALGTDMLGDLYEAIQNRNVLKLTYHPFTEKQPVIIVIHPYFLKEYNNRWFMFGYNPQQKRIDNLALDRIKQAAVCNECFIDNELFKPEHFFANIIGVTLPTDGRQENVVVKISAQRAPYVVSKPFHQSQEVRPLPDGSCEVSLQLVPNKELETLLLSFGPDLEVLMPESLRKQVQQKLEQAASAYL